MFAHTSKPIETTTSDRGFFDAFEAATHLRIEELAKSGELLGSGEMQEAMSFELQALNKALEERHIFAIEGATGTRMYPAFFASSSYDRDTLFAVSKALGDLPGLSKWQFFTQPKTSLGRKAPLEALTNGEVEAVLRGAKAFVER
jgi:hypothetical protein